MKTKYSLFRPFSGNVSVPHKGVVDPFPIRPTRFPIRPPARAAPARPPTGQLPTGPAPTGQLPAAPAPTQLPAAQRAAPDVQVQVLGARKKFISGSLQGAAVVGVVAYASYESLKNHINKKEVVEENVTECVFSCLPQHTNIENPEYPIALSGDNYNDDALKEWYFPSENLLNGPDCPEENKAVCHKPRDCTVGDVRLVCKPNSKETFERCGEYCKEKCRRCFSDPKLTSTVLETVASTATESAEVFAETFADTVGGMLEALGIDPSMVFYYALFFFCCIILILVAK